MVKKLQDKPWPTAKKGKARMVAKTPMKVQSQAWHDIPYVRTKEATPTTRRNRETWRRCLFDFVNKEEDEIVQMLTEDGWLVDWKGKTCQHCGKGTLGPMKIISGRGCRWRCNHYACKKLTLPQQSHPIFSIGSGSSAVPLALQALVIFCAIAGVRCVTARVLFKKNHKMIEKMYERLRFVRRMYVEKREKLIEFGNRRGWSDVEADEAVFRKEFVDLRFYFPPSLSRHVVGASEHVASCAQGK